MGDWNVDAAEIQQISFGEAVQGEWLVTGQSTIQTGNELDYVLVSASLSSPGSAACRVEGAFSAACCGVSELELVARTSANSAN